MPPHHSQIWAKVNTHVDHGVAGLVEALSKFPQLQTLESCEGDGQQPIWACFYFGRYWERPWEDCAAFVLGYLGPGLMRLGASAQAGVYCAGTNRALGEIKVSKEALPSVENAIRRLAEEFTAYPRP